MGNFMLWPIVRDLIIKPWEEGTNQFVIAFNLSFSWLGMGIGIGIGIPLLSCTNNGRAHLCHLSFTVTTQNLTSSRTVLSASTILGKLDWLIFYTTTHQNLYNIDY
ncbi:hypothetical protein E1A91_D02G233500v1 [Gossypium mustelinum]|uniref:Uncharacterized protein n=1 Tax=Gossypium mustelinum TaxID=34275 RepID=A0A5D2VZY9_GOSMU|nr:hypothetical protein E1A91_D02G233500v1 [Gossypium mustelinum]